MGDKGFHSLVHGTWRGRGVAGGVPEKRRNYSSGSADFLSFPRVCPFPRGGPRLTFTSRRALSGFRFLVCVCPAFAGRSSCPHLRTPSERGVQKNTMPNGVCLSPNGCGVPGPLSVLFRSGSSLVHLSLLAATTPVALRGGLLLVARGHDGPPGPGNCSSIRASRMTVLPTPTTTLSTDCGPP